MLTPVSNSSAARRAAALRDLVEARPLPIEAEVDRHRFAPRQQSHRPGVTLRPSHLLGYAEAGRASLVRWIVDEPALAVDQGIDQAFHVHHLVHAAHSSSSRTASNHIGEL